MLAAVSKYGAWPPWNCSVRGQARSPEWGDGWSCSRFCCKLSYILTNKTEVYICEGIQRSAFCFRTVAGSSCCWWFPASQVVTYILHYTFVNSCMSEFHCYSVLPGFLVGFFDNGVRNGFSYHPTLSLRITQYQLDDSVTKTVAHILGASTFQKHWTRYTFFFILILTNLIH